MTDTNTMTSSISTDGTVLTITVNRPPVNAWVEEGYNQLCNIIREVNDSDSICAVVLRAEGRLFSGGADVNRLAEDGHEAAARRRPRLRAAGSALAGCQVPVIVAAHGKAVGVGAVFVSLADVILATEDFELMIPEIRVGVVGAAAAMRRMVPEHLARSMALTGRSATASQLHTIGSVDQILPTKDALYQAADKTAVNIASNGYLAVRKWKEALNLTDPIDASRGLVIEQCFSQELTMLSPAPALPR